MSDEALEWLTAGGAPSASFPEVGAKIVGKVLDYELKQARDFGTKKPKTWEDGSPIMEAVITVQAEQFEQVDEEDDGTRRIFVSSRGLRDAVRSAIKKSGHRGSLVGGRLGVTYTADGEKKSGLNPPASAPSRCTAPRR